MSMARTNIDIDEEACRRVMERFNLTTMKDAVNLALRTLAIEPMSILVLAILIGYTPLLHINLQSLNIAVSTDV